MFEPFFVTVINDNIKDSFATQEKYGIDYAVDILAPRDGDHIKVFKVNAARPEHALSRLDNTGSLLIVADFLYKK